ncbi:Uncharacterised protein [Streptococcus suis]|nr:Uncharacterised protein [Streptococcus suis]
MADLIGLKIVKVIQKKKTVYILCRFDSATKPGEIIDGE